MSSRTARPAADRSASTMRSVGAVFRPLGPSAVQVLEDKSTNTTTITDFARYLS